MEKFKDGGINAMSIIVESIKDHLRPYISHLDSSKKIKMNNDDNITSYLVRISELRDQLQAIEEIILEKELVNIVFNGLPKTWDAFAASMNTRKEYPTFEELWTCCAQEESRINAKEKPQKKYKTPKVTKLFLLIVHILFT